MSVRMKGGWEVNERRLARLRRGAKKQEWLGARRVSGADTLDALLCSYGLTARGGSSTLRPNINDTALKRLLPILFAATH